MRRLDPYPIRISQMYFLKKSKLVQCLWGMISDLAVTGGRLLIPPFRRRKDRCAGEKFIYFDC